MTRLQWIRRPRSRPHGGPPLPQMEYPHSDRKGEGYKSYWVPHLRLIQCLPYHNSYFRSLLLYHHLHLHHVRENCSGEIPSMAHPIQLLTGMLRE
jgi:hypothetical protein